MLLGVIAETPLALHTAAIRQYLCLSLLKNSASSIPAALQLSASIYLSLLQKFRSALKAEVGVFFPMIMLKVGLQFCKHVH